MSIYEETLRLGSSIILPGRLAQISTESIESASGLIGESEVLTGVEPSQVVYGPQFFVALLSGVILAFGFQLLLTNLSMAAGVSYVAHSGNRSSENDEGTTGIKTMGIAFGLWTVVTVSLALFFACWLSLRLTAYSNPFLGAVTALVIWATYFSLLMWFSATAVGSLVGSVVRSASHGFQTMVSAATATFDTQSTSKDSASQTIESTVAAVRRELTNSLDVTDIQEGLQDYINGLKSAAVDVSAVEEEFEQLLLNSELSNVDRESFPQASRELFTDLLKENSNLSVKERKQVANRLYQVWQKHTNSRQGLSELMAFVTSATGSQLAAKGLGDQLSKLIQEVHQHRQNDAGDRPVMRVIEQGMNALVGLVLAKVDLSDMDASTLVDQIKLAQRLMVSQVKELAPAPLSNTFSDKGSVIKLDVENYIQHAYIGELKSPKLEEIFRNILFDAEADKAELRRQLSAFGRPFFSQVLSSRGFFTEDEIKNIATRLEIVRQQVIKDVTSAELISAEKRVRQKIETFFKFTPAAELLSDMGNQAFRALIEAEPLELDQLRDYISQLNADYFRQFLVTRDDIAAHETAERYEQLLSRIIADAEGLSSAVKVRLQQQQNAVAQYLRKTHKAELSPEGIKRDVKALLDEPSDGIRRVRSRLAKFDRNTFIALLEQRPEFSAQEAETIVNTVEHSWTKAMQEPHNFGLQAQAKLEEATNAVEQYLRDTNKPELNPEGIKRDLQRLLDHPKAGAMAIRYRLSKMNRSTLVELLSQRDDLSEAEINQTIDTILSTIQSLTKSPRRVARRVSDMTQVQACSFQSALEDYLRNTHKAELNPVGIKRDLKLLLNDPKLGMSQLGDRLSQMDDSTVVALLAQRSDISETEAKEIVGQIANVRHQVKAQLRSTQRSLEAAVESIFSRVRDFLQSLDRPELNYYAIKRDVRILLEDPQAGLASLRARLSLLDRHTLVALVSAHESISEADAYQVIAQIESARDSVLRKAAAVEQQLETHIRDVKAQAQKQISEAKKASEVAAWWLFGTAFISAILAAIGGSLAVVG